MAVTTAYEMGDWDAALRRADHQDDIGMPSWAAASIDAAAAGVLAARGLVTAHELVAATRPWWPEEGRIAVQVGAAALDVLGRDGDVEPMLQLHADVVEFQRGLWGHGRVAAEVRFAALVVGHLVTALRPAPPGRRALLLAPADRRRAVAEAVWGVDAVLPPPSLEGRVWQARAEAEYQHARWAAGDDVPLEGLVARWREVVGLVEQRREPYELARTRGRLAEVLLAAGERGATEVLHSARSTAAGLGAAPLVTALDRLAPRQRPVASALTARESEVLALLARGRSNGEIGRALFISTKTASVHVSNILAKLGASSRGEAVALARGSGLLED